MKGLDPFPTFSNQENNRNEKIIGHTSNALGYLSNPLLRNFGCFIILSTMKLNIIFIGFRIFQKSPIIGVIIPNPTHHIIQIIGAEKFSIGLFEPKYPVRIINRNINTEEILINDLINLNEVLLSVF